MLNESYTDDKILDNLRLRTTFHVTRQQAGKISTHTLVARNGVNSLENIRPFAIQALVERLANTMSSSIIGKMSCCCRPQGRYEASNFVDVQEGGDVFIAGRRRGWTTS